MYTLLKNSLSLYLIKLDLLGGSTLFVGVMAKRDIVVVIGEGHHSLALLLGHREQVLEDVGRSLPEPGSVTELRNESLALRGIE